MAPLAHSLLAAAVALAAIATTAARPLHVKAGSAAVPPQEEQQLFAIVTAYYAEFKAVFPLLDNTHNETHVGRFYARGTLGGFPVVLTVSGEGIVNAALTTQSLIERYSPANILFAGVATGIGGSALRNDVAIPTKWANAGRMRMAEVLEGSDGQPSSDFYVLSYDVDRPNQFLRTDNGTIASITVPAEGCLAPPDEEAVEAITNPGGAVTDNFGIPMASSVLSRPDGQQAFMRAADQDQAIWFDVDPDLLAVAEAMIEAENVTFSSTCFNAYTNKTTQLGYTPTIKIVPEGGLSVDQYIANVDYASKLNALFGGEVFDMESAAFQHVCATNQVPCLVIRSLPNDITDLASADCSTTAFPNLQTTVGLFFKHFALRQR